MARLQAKDGEYKKQDLVTIEMDAFRAMLFAPEKLNAKAGTMPGILAQARDDIVEEQYIVTVRRIQGTWEYTIHHDGDEIKLPAEVVDRINKSRDLIISRGRKDAARNRLQRVAAGDQAAAARKPDNAAGAMCSWAWTIGWTKANTPPNEEGRRGPHRTNCPHPRPPQATPPHEGLGEVRPRWQLPVLRSRLPGARLASRPATLLPAGHRRRTLRSVGASIPGFGQPGCRRPALPPRDSQQVRRGDHGLLSHLRRRKKRSASSVLPNKSRHRRGSGGRP